MIETTIPKTIQNVCQTRQIHCLHAIESGSRAWGFHSPDSDYDVRLLYCHSLDWYLQVFDDKDSFEFIQNDVLAVPFDIGGWELKKALQLLAKSNAVIFEWLNSPIVYACDDVFVQQLKTIQSQFFNPKAIFYHYQGMAKNTSAGLDLTKPMRLKKYFYLLRALLASVWVKEQNCLVPVEMLQMARLLTDDELNAINELIILKQQVDEQHQFVPSPILQNLIHRLWAFSETLPFGAFQKGDVRLLDELLKNTVLTYANH